MPFRTTSNLGRARWALAWCSLLLIGAASTQSGDDLRPSLAHLARIDDAERLSYVATLGDEKSLAAKRTAVWAIAYGNPEGGATALRSLLEDDYDDAVLEIEEESVLREAVLGLGLIAVEDDEVFRYLAARTDTETWEDSMGWSSRLGDYSVDLMVSSSIQALGLSGRPMTRELLAILKEKSKNYLHRFAGDVVQAEFYLFLRDRDGEEGVWEYLLGQDKSHFTAWIQEGAGKKAFDWANASMSGPRPE